MDGYIYKYTTRGIYELGCGWVSQEVGNKWKSFWDFFSKTGKYTNGSQHCEPIFWRVLPRDMPDSCDTLVCLGGSMWLHPMQGEMFRRNISSNSCDGYYKELKNILHSCIKFIGIGEVDVLTVPAEIKIKKTGRKKR